MSGVILPAVYAVTSPYIAQAAAYSDQPKIHPSTERPSNNVQHVGKLATEPSTAETQTADGLSTYSSTKHNL